MYQEIKDRLTGVVTSIKRVSDEACIPFVSGNKEYDEYVKWLAAGNTPAPDPEHASEKVKARRLDEIRAGGVQALETAGYPAHKQTQMTVFVLGEVIKTLMAVIVKTGVTVDTTELGKVVAMIPALTDLTFPQVGLMATEIGKVRAGIMAVEAQMLALPITATVADVESVANTPIPKPKKRRDIEEGK